MSDDYSPANKDRGGNANIVYILYLVGIVIPLVPVIGVIMAYLGRGDAADWQQTHYTFQIRTFWIGILYSLVAVALTFIMVGFVLFPVILVWYIVRCVKGLNAVSKSEPIAEPESWVFG